MAIKQTDKFQKSHLRPLGTAEWFEMCPDSRLRFPESRVGKRPRLPAVGSSKDSSSSSSSTTTTTTTTTSDNAA